jgi:hypothetical protein
MMDKWLKTGNVRKTRENELSPPANVSSGPTCAKLGSDDKTERGVGKSQVKNRKYDYDYIKVGFTCCGNKECPKPRCVICGDVLANRSLKHSLLCRHLETRHPNQINKPVDVFERKLVEPKNVIANFVSTTSNDNENALEASEKHTVSIFRAELDYYDSMLLLFLFSIRLPTLKSQNYSRPTGKCIIVMVK